MRPLIIIENENLTLHCDNPKCGYEKPEEIPHQEARSWVNVPCPKCGENLLTKDDFDRWERFIKITKWVNKWFSWISIFISEKNYQECEVSSHKKLTITPKAKV